MLANTIAEIKSFAGVLVLVVIAVLLFWIASGLIVPRPAGPEAPRVVQGSFSSAQRADYR